MKPTRKNVMNGLIRSGIEYNGGKVLAQSRTKGCYLIRQRDRESQDQRYFTTVIKGNHIKTFEIRHLVNGSGINTFVNVAIPVILSNGQFEEPKIETTTTLLVKTKLKDYEHHVDEFKKKAPTLNWYSNMEDSDD